MTFISAALIHQLLQIIFISAAYRIGYAFSLTIIFAT